MFTETKQTNLIAILAHILLGYVAINFNITALYSYIIVGAGLVLIVFNSNSNEEATLWSAYLVGVEVFLRMSRGVVFYELGKYAVIVFLIVALFTEKRRHSIPPIYIIYILLLLLGIVFTNVPFGVSLRRVIAFNLSGPFLLGIAALYFYKRAVTKAQLFRVLFYAILPVFSMVTYMYFKTPDLADIRFGGESLGETSGGFGPNQVATIIGFAVFIVALFLFLKVRLTGFLFLDVVVLIYFAYRGLLTFSRGGMMAAGIALVIFALIMIFGGDHKVRDFFKYTFIMAFIMIGIWLYTSDVTGGMLDNRYTGKNANGIQKSEIASGRIEIFKGQLEAFYSNPIVGIGVGGTKYYKSKDSQGITAHDEIGRLIAEHGLIGIFLLVILLLTPLPHILSQDYYIMAILIAFYLFWFLTINHSAMRVAFPGWIYGLALIQITDFEEDNEDLVYEETD